MNENLLVLIYASSFYDVQSFKVVWMSDANQLTP